MTGKQFGEHLGLRQPRVIQIEKDEVSGAVTMNTMRQAAEALDWVFVYVGVLRARLEETMRNQARKVAEKHRLWRSHTMLPESQQMTGKERRKMLESKTDDLAREIPKDFRAQK